MVVSLFPDTTTLTPQADGVAATTANLGASTVATSGGTTAWEADDAKNGENGVWINQTATSGAVRNVYTLPTAAKVYSIYIEGLRTPPANPSISRILTAVRRSGAVAFSLLWGTSGNLFITPTSGSNVVVAAAGVLANNTKYNVEILVTVDGTNAANGTVSVRVFPAASTTPVSGATLASTAMNLGTADLVEIDMGGTGAVVGSFGYWRVQAEPNRTTGLSNYVANTYLASPTVTAVTTDPTTIGGTNGKVVLTWSAVSGAHHYEAFIGEGTITSSFTATDVAAVSPKTFNGLHAGPYTWAVRTKATA